MRSRLACLEAAGIRFDANETAFLEKQLEFVEAKTYDILYTKLKAREFVPLEFSLPEWASTWTYRVWDEAGMAELITSYSDDLKRVDVVVTEEEHKVFEFGDAYGYTINDLRTSARLSQPLDVMRARAAKNAMERKMDELISIGSTRKSITGFVNNANVPETGVDNGDWLNAATTSDEILDDMFQMESAVIDQSEENHEPTDLILPPEYYNKIKTKPRSSTSDKTVLQYFLENSQTVKNVSRWKRLATAGAGETPIAICYMKSPDIVKFPIAIEFEQLEPEKRNLEYVINCIAKTGGTTWMRPLGGTYGTGIGA